MVRMTDEQLLQQLYTDPGHPASLSSARRLWLAARARHRSLRLSDVQRWLTGNETWTKYARARHRYPTNPWVVAGLNSCHHADLAFFNDLRRWNDGYSTLLVSVDVLSRFICVEPLRSKTAQHVAEAYERMLGREADRIPSRLVTDKGGEFMGGPFQRLLRDYRIQHVLPKNPTVKACYAENAIWRIKNKLEKYMNAVNSFRWIDCIGKIVSSLNATLLPSIGMAPVDVNHQNADFVHQRLYVDGRQQQQKPRQTFQKGDVVRISLARSTFSKGSRRQRFSEELFQVHKILWRERRACYVLKDLAGEILDAFFYTEELQRFVPAADQSYPINRILRRRVRNGKKELFVSFRGYPPKFNQWIPATDILQG